MGKLNYRKITEGNFHQIISLSDTLTKEQQACVAPNVYSIAQGSLKETAYYRGIFVEDTAIGFFMLDIPNEKSIDEEKDFYLWRFMIAYDQQHKHYGTEALDHIVSIGKEHGFKQLVTSCHLGEVSPYQFYINYGFIDTHKMDGDEEVLILNF